MITIQLITVGKLKEKFLLQAVEEYAKRLSAYCKLTVVELPEERLPDRPSPAQIESALAKESQAIQSKLLKSSTVVALCVEGSLMSSEALATTFNGWMVDGQSTLSFVIGGSYGLHPSVKARAALRLSMSQMTFPHHLARVMVLEQIYRSFKILEGSQYHK